MTAVWSKKYLNSAKRMNEYLMLEQVNSEAFIYIYIIVYYIFSHIVDGLKPNSQS